MNRLGGSRMESDAVNAFPVAGRAPAVLVEVLVRLYSERFGGASGGKYRISRKFLRQLAGRRRLPDDYLAALADGMFEAGFVFVNCESYFIVLSQKQFASYRRVTALAVNKVMSNEDANNEPKIERSKENDQKGVREIGGKPPRDSVQANPTN